MYYADDRQTLQVMDPRDGAGLGIDIPGMATTGTAIATSIPSVAAFSLPVFGTVAAAAPIIGGAIAAIAWGVSQIGKGRREADIIVPVQNDVDRKFLQPVSQFLGVTMGGVGTVNPNLTRQQLMEVRSQIVAMSNQWLAFVRDAAFKDGRASGQAANTIMPYLNGTAGYGDFARGGGRAVARHPDNGRAIQGGLLGAVDRAIAAVPASSSQGIPALIAAPELERMTEAAGEPWWASEIAPAIAFDAGPSLPGLPGPMIDALAADGGGMMQAGFAPAAVDRRGLLLLAVAGAGLFLLRKKK